MGGSGHAPGPGKALLALGTGLLRRSADPMTTVGNPALRVQVTNCPPDARLLPGIGISGLTQFPAVPGHDAYYLPPVISGDIPASKDGMGVRARLVIPNQHPGLLRIAGRVINDSRGSDHGYR